MADPPPELRVAPIAVVTGPPRSGTSLVMQMLAAGGVEPLTDHRRVADEDNARGYFEHQAVLSLRRDPAILSEAPGKAVKVIHALLPHIPAGLPLVIFFLHRDLDEVLDSQDTMLQRLDRPLAAVPRERMRELLHRQLQSARAALDARSGTHVLDLEHRELITQPAAAARRMAAFLNEHGPWTADDQKMAACVHPTLYRHRKPVS